MVDFKVLVVDRDRAASQVLETAVGNHGMTVTVEATKEKALNLSQKEGYNIVLFDPLPQQEARPFIIGLRRGSSQTGRYVYAVPMSRDKTREEVLLFGGNDHLKKPFEAGDIKPVLDNAQRFLKLYHELKVQEESNRIYCDGSMLGNAALTQVFLTAVDRADRYGEKAYFLNIEVTNYKELLKSWGEEKAKNAMDNFSLCLKRIRRQSDMIGRFEINRFALIMQRPVNDREPADATARLKLSIEEFLKKPEFKGLSLKVSLRTISIPIGEVVADLSFHNFVDRVL